MARNKRNLAGFDAVAAEVENTSNINTNVNINVNNDVIDEILGGKQAKQLVGIYFDEDLAIILNQLADKKRGAKSAIVNEALRRLFQEKGLI